MSTDPVIQCEEIDLQTGTIKFRNGVTAQHDLIIGADGIGSVVRGIIGIQPTKTPSEQSCLHANVTTEEAVKLGLVDYSQDSALEYWGGQEGKWDKIVLSPCNGGKLLSYYCFFPRDKGDYTNQTWGGEDRPVEELLEPFPELDSQVLNHLKIGKEIRPWRLWVQYVDFPLFLATSMLWSNLADWHVAIPIPTSTRTWFVFWEMLDIR